jgi:hypothetical protein
MLATAKLNAISSGDKPMPEYNQMPQRVYAFKLSNTLN